MSQIKLPFTLFEYANLAILLGAAMYVSPDPIKDTLDAIAIFLVIFSLIILYLLHHWPSIDKWKQELLWLSTNSAMLLAIALATNISSLFGGIILLVALYCIFTEYKQKTPS